MSSPWQIYNLHRIALRTPPEYRFVKCPYDVPECRCCGFTEKDLEFLNAAHITEPKKCDTDEDFLAACGISPE